MSPEVWTDCLPRIQAVAATYGVHVELPVEDAGERPEPPAPWLAIDVAAELAEQIELNANVWNEDGTIWIHLFIPNGTGITTGLAIRKAFSVAFRVAAPTTPGIYYRGHSFDPVGADDGVYRRLSVAIHYNYTDIIS